MKLTLKTTGQQADIIKILTPLKSTALMTEIGHQLVGIAQGNFTDGAQRPVAWPARKDKKGHGLLNKTGAMFKGTAILSVAAGKVTFGSKAQYSPVHQFGAAAKPHQRTTTRKVKRKFLEVVMGNITGKKFTAVSDVSKTWTHPGSAIPPRPFFPVRPGTDQLTDYAERAVAHTVAHFLKNRT